MAELVREVTRTQVTIRCQHLGAVIECLLFEFDQHRQVGIATRVVIKVRTAWFTIGGEIELTQDHVTHGHGHGCVGTLLGMQPNIRELGHFREVRRDRNGFSALVSNLSKEVRVWRTGLGHV